MAHTPSRNLVFIGEIGAGKTLLIDTLTKYFTYDNFDAITANVAKETLIPIEKNTTQTKLHTVAIGDTVYNLLDTPGFKEEYGKPKNYEIFKEIEAAFLQLPEIHGICFVIKASKEVMPNFIEKVITNTLTIFPKKAAVCNCFFIFTHANECHFTSGTGSAKIRQIIQNFENSYDAKIRYSVENICTIDNLGMRWLIALKNGLSRPPIREIELQACWNESKKQLEKMLNAASELPGITRDEIVQCRLLKEIGILLHAESIPTSEAQKLQYVLCDGIYKATIISKFDNIVVPSQSGTPMALGKLIEGLSLIKRAVKSEELKQKIDELCKFKVVVEEVTVADTAVIDPIPPEPVLPIIVPEKHTVDHQHRPQPIPRKPPNFIIPPPPTVDPAPETPIADYEVTENFKDGENSDDDGQQQPQVPQSRQLELLQDIAEGIADNCEQGDLTNIYESELKSINKAVTAPSHDSIDFKDLTQALRVFEHNPKIGTKTKSYIREYLNGLPQ